MFAQPITRNYRKLPGIPRKMYGYTECAMRGKGRGEIAPGRAAQECFAAMGKDLKGLREEDGAPGERFQNFFGRVCDKHSPKRNRRCAMGPCRLML
jgi:hypothetical protein